MENSTSAEEHVRLEAIGDQLRAKITSKFQTSTVLAGFAFTVLGIELTILWQSPLTPGLLPWSIGLSNFAILLYVSAVVRLDALTMPKRFWKEDKGKTNRAASRQAYLTDDDLWELRKQMIFHWISLTLIATAGLAASLFLLLWPTSFNKLTSEVLVETFQLVIIAIAGWCVYLAILWLATRKYFRALMREAD
jgi:hypothetical protein